MHPCLGSEEIRGYGFERKRLSRTADLGYFRHVAAGGGEMGTLALEFVRGGVWYYFDVPERVFEEFLLSESRGRYFHKFIRGTYREARAETGSEA
jgi:KTSC domain